MAPSSELLQDGPLSALFAHASLRLCTAGGYPPGAAGGGSFLENIFCKIEAGQLRQFKEFRGNSSAPTASSH